MSKQSEVISPLFTMEVRPRSIEQALFINAVVMPQVVKLIQTYSDDLKDLEEEKEI